MFGSCYYRAVEAVSRGGLGNVLLSMVLAAGFLYIFIDPWSV